jgi:hypothetical protein
MPDVSTEVVIATQTINNSPTTVVLSSIPATYTDLRIVMVRPGSSGTSAGYPSISAINGSTTTDKNYTILYGDGSAPATFRSASSSSIILSNGGGTAYSAFTLDVFSYSNTTTFKSMLGASMSDTNGGGYVDRVVGTWRSTAAINSITFTSNAGTNGFQPGTIVTVYGIL